MSGDRRRRPMWLTAPLYVLTLAIVALDGWAIWFWARVDGSLGRGLALAGAAVALLLLALLVVDARRQWLLSVASDPGPAE